MFLFPVWGYNPLIVGQSGSVIEKQSTVPATQGRKDLHGKEVNPGEKTKFYTAGGPSRTFLTAGRNYIDVKESML